MTAIIPFPLFIIQYAFDFSKIHISPHLLHSIFTFTTLKDLDMEDRPQGLRTHGNGLEDDT